MQCLEPALPARRAAPGIHLRGSLSPTHDRQGPQSGYGVVLHARFGMARAPGEFPALAGAVEFRPGGPATAFALPPEREVIFYLEGCFLCFDRRGSASLSAVASLLRLRPKPPRP